LLAAAVVVRAVAPLITVLVVGQVATGVPLLGRILAVEPLLNQ
jgi:type III secretory pathway component EscU